MTLVNNGQMTVNIYTTPPPTFQAPDAGNSLNLPQYVKNEKVRLHDEYAGKPRPWRGKKVGTVKLSKALYELGQNKKANRVWWCGAELEFRENPETGKKRLTGAQFCRERLCVMCSWRRSYKMFYQLSQVLDIAQEENPDIALLFLTLTVKNCSGDDLAAQLDDMFAGWQRLTNHRRVKRAIKGWFRALEVTYNKETDAYHPHFHAILMVDKHYFFDRKAYMHTADWVHIWRTSCRLDYDPVCDIRAVRNADPKRNRKHVAEVTKYTIKEPDILHNKQEVTVKVVDVLGKALFKRRLHAYGGILKLIAKRLAVEAKEDDLVNLNDADTIREDVAGLLAIYQWDFGLSDYFKLEVKGDV